MNNPSNNIENIEQNIFGQSISNKAEIKKKIHLNRWGKVTTYPDCAYFGWTHVYF